MPKKTTILIVILAIITGLLILLAVRNDNTLTLLNQKDTNPSASASPTQMPSYATLSFSPPVLDVSAAQSNQQTAIIIIDSHGKPISAAQVELSYNPQVISNVTLLPAQVPFFGDDQFVAINSVDATQGRISYAVGIPPQNQEKVGSGNLFTLKFTVNKSSGISSTQIEILSKSAVTTLSTRGSVLQSTTPLQIIVTAPSASVSP